MWIISQSIQYQKRPSEILFINDEYTSYCFDEACFFIITQEKEGKKAKFEKRKEDVRADRTSVLNRVEELRKNGGMKEVGR